MAAWVATRKNLGDSDLLPARQAGTACTRKLPTILDAMLKSGMPWRVTASQPA
jgi:hypothetical protein